MSVSLLIYLLLAVGWLLALFPLASWLERRADEADREAWDAWTRGRRDRW